MKVYDSDDDDTQVVRLARQMLSPVSHLLQRQYFKILRRDRMGDRIGYNKDKVERENQ